MKERANPSQNEVWRHFKGGEYKNHYHSTRNRNRGKYGNLRGTL